MSTQNEVLAFCGTLASFEAFMWIPTTTNSGCVMKKNPEASQGLKMVEWGLVGFRNIFGIKKRGDLE